MSGLARLDKQGNWQGSGDSPLTWLREHYRLDLPPAGSAVSWPEPEMQVELLTAVQPQTGETASPRELPAAWDFHPEAAPFQVSFPSGLAAPPEETATRPETEAAEDGDAARLRGVIMHRALQTLARGGPRAGCGLPGRRPPAGGPDRARRPPPWRRKFRRNSRPARRTRSCPPSWPRISPGRPASGSWKTNPTRAPSAGGSSTIWPSTATTGGSWTSRPPAPPPGRTGKPSSPGRPRSTAPNSWPTGRWRPRPRGLNRRRPSAWESISPPAGRWWRCEVFGYKYISLLIARF